MHCSKVDETATGSANLWSGTSRACRRTGLGSARSSSLLGNGYPVVMPMLHSCSFPGCETLTLSPYCFEHERVIRAELESERAQAAVRDEPLARELAEAAEPVVASALG